MTPVRRLGEAPSTSAEARAAFERGEDGPFWFQADRQTAGYGRRGRSWHDAAGNLFATLLLPTTLPLAARAPATWSFAAALAVRDACLAHGAPAELTFKWPNDVLLGGAKLSGVLIELLTHQSRAAAAIGIGVNLAVAPPIGAYPTAALHPHGDAPDPLAFLETLDAALSQWLARDRTDGLEPLRKAWLDAAHGIGGPLTVRRAGGVLEGVFEGLAEDGSLLLRTPGGLEAVTAGDVFFSGQPS